ncbi:MAG: lycopene cyclase family protein [Alphaproteobacteria bacterium]
MSPFSRFDTDVAVLGGGCAGLSLAARLAGASPGVTVIEPRTGYADDRTWSFWRTDRDPFVGCVRAHWDRWAVSAAGERVVRGSARLRYETLGAMAFYDQAIATIDAAPNTELRLGTRVTAEPRPLGDGFAIATDAGECRARTVVDTRPPGGAPGFGQYFTGAEIEVDGAAFDPTTVELMDFAAARPDRIDFLYVLPFAADRALVEATSFAPTPPPRGTLEATLAQAIARFAQGRAVREVRREQGFIPMRPQAAQRTAATGHPGWVRAGLVGGAARPSTGYAFQRIQQASDRLAAQLRAGQRPTPPALDGRITRFMDALFLSVIRRRSALGPQLFLQLFRHAPPDRLERFLAGSTASTDRLAVITALPPKPFLRELLVP